MLNACIENHDFKKKEETPILAPFNNLLHHIPFCARSLIPYSAFNV